MKLAEVFARCRKRDELVFMPYQTAGYPSLDESIANLHVLAERGADVLELGIPFSDPMADGPTIQFSSQAALEAGVTLWAVLNRLKSEELAAPIVLMSYLNPLLAYNRERLFAELRAAGIAGLIVPDLPVEESDEWLVDARRAGVSLIFLLAPTSTEERIRQVAERTGAFIYAVSLTGTTGSRAALFEGLPAFLERIRSATDKPIVVGFGISTPEHVRALHGKADGVIVASRLIDAIRRREDWAELASSLKAATRR